MEITYKSVKLRSEYEDDKLFIKEYGVDIHNAYRDFIEVVSNPLITSLHVLQIMHRGKRIEKLEPKHLNKWSARLNKQYRVIFTCDDLSPFEIQSIEIIKVDPHTYK